MNITTLKRTLLGAFLFTTVAFLSACQAESSQKEPIKMNPNPQTSVSETRASANFSAADQVIYDGALQMRDGSFCDKMSKEDGKILCKKAVDDQKALENALMKVDTTLCDSITDKDAKDACTARVELKIKQAQMAQEREVTAKGMYEQYNKIVDAGNEVGCGVLSDSNLLASCEYNIVLNKALTQKDKNLCSKISTPALAQDCVRTVEQASK